MDLDLPRHDSGDMPGAPDVSAISRVERRLEMLDELAEIGMNLARDLAARAAAAAFTPSEEPRREPGPAFAQISRAVRLTLAMQGSLEADLVALRKGETPTPPPSRPTPPPSAPPPPPSQGLAQETSPRKWTPEPPVYLPVPAPGEPDTRGHAETSKDSPCRHRNRIRDAVWTAVDGAYNNIIDSGYAFDRLHERLIEGEFYDQVLFRPWRETVAAICDDLDLKPDWTQWSDESGFPPNEKYRLANSWTYRFTQQAWRRGQYAEMHGGEPAPKPPPTPPPTPPPKDGRPLE